MKIFERLTKWMEENLETPLYKAEMLRADLLKRERAINKYSGHKNNKKVIAFRTAK